MLVGKQWDRVGTQLLVLSSLSEIRSGTRGRARVGWGWGHLGGERLGSWHFLGGWFVGAVWFGWLVEVFHCVGA